VVPTPGGRDAEGSVRDLQAVIDAITDYAIIRLDHDGTVTAWSQGAEAVTGYTAAEAVGRPISMLYTEEDRTAGLLERSLQAARGQGRYESEGWRLRKGGKQFWASSVTAPVHGDGGQVTGYVKVVRDTTERQRAEVMFRGLLEAAPDAVVITDADGRIVMVNRQVEDMFGHRREDLVGQDVEVLVPQRFRQGHPALRDSFFRAPRARPMGAGIELYAMRRDGSEFPVEISLSPLETDRGVLVSAAIRDVTEHRQQLLQLRRQRDEILELSTPVIQVWDKVLALPIIGTLDSGRAARLTESLLNSIAEHQAEVIILDVSGVPTVDTLVAQHLLKTVQAATLMGAISILSGVRPEMAQAIVHLGIDLGRLRSRYTLRDALQLALQIVRNRACDAEGAERARTPGATP
jgi:rsbT co-antagonist protein RsbR